MVRLLDEMLMDEVRDELRASDSPLAAFADVLSDDELRAALEDERRAKPLPLLEVDPHTKDYVFNGHRGAGPSGASRWAHCTASLEDSRAFLETLTPNQQAEFSVGSEAARQGTTAHSAGEVKIRHLLGEVDTETLDATLLSLATEPAPGEELTQEMEEYLEEYVDLVGTFISSGRTVKVEERLETAIPLTVPWPSGEYYVITGSGDAVAYPTKEEPELDVVDLKYGSGLDVSVEENPQLRLYGLGALTNLVDSEGNLTTDVGTINYWIVQPRLGGVKHWSETVESLLAWRDDVLAPALSLALAGRKGGAYLNPSPEACEFCPVRGSCVALIESRVEAASELFDTLIGEDMGEGAAPETGAMSDDELGRMYSQVLGLIDLKDDLKEEVTRRMHRGTQVPGFKLVSYQPPRKWSEEAGDALAGEDSPWVQESLWVKKLVTPTQALKVAKGDASKEVMLAPLISTPDKRAVVAPEGDRRKDWEGIPPEKMFADETTG